MNTTRHVSPQELERLRQGRLLPAEIAELARHAAACEACRRAVGESYEVGRRVRELLDVEHLPEDVLMAHADGLLPADDHLDECDRCRAEVEELRRLKPVRRRRSPWVIYAVAASIAAVALVLWSLTSRPDRVVPPRRTAPPVSVQPAPYVREDWEREVADARRRRELSAPAVITQWQSRKGSLRGGAEEGEIRLTPNRLVVSGARPLFQWTPRPGATYKVILQSGREIAESDSLKAAEWRPSTDLRRGVEYLWQVEMTTPAGRSILPRPPTPPARFRVLDDQAWSEINEAHSRYPQDALLHAVLLARHGLRDEALEALEPLRGTDASLADALRASLQKWPE